MRGPGLQERHLRKEDPGRAKRGVITSKIKSGTLLIAQGALLPTGLEYEGDPFSEGWTIVRKLDPNGLDQIVRDQGWTLFFIAGPIEMIGIGGNQRRASEKALRKIVNSINGQRYNCLEISEVSAKRFLGIPYVKVSVHLRHIQKGLVLFESTEPPQVSQPRQNPNSEKHAKENLVTAKWRPNQI